ncbi:MAG TPA: response regulator [Polyangiaceae bacterium]|jgi:CheY-like chemotaxis protein|nr:response regulator [Polyangiaceae bacterium]
MAESRRILLAEDNEDLLRAVTRLAEGYGHDVIQTALGGEVLSLALEHRPHLIVLDITFPDMDGRDVLARLKAEERTADIPVLIWSGRMEAESDRRIALELGAEDYLEKIDAPALLRKIERVFLRFE